MLVQRGSVGVVPVLLKLLPEHTFSRQLFLQERERQQTLVKTSSASLVTFNIFALLKAGTFRMLMKCCSFSYLLWIYFKALEQTLDLTQSQQSNVGGAVHT